MLVLRSLSDSGRAHPVRAPTAGSPGSPTKSRRHSQRSERSGSVDSQTSKSPRNWIQKTAPSCSTSSRSSLRVEPVCTTTSLSTSPKGLQDQNSPLAAPATIIQNASSAFSRFTTRSRDRLYNSGELKKSQLLGLSSSDGPQPQQHDPKRDETQSTLHDKLTKNSRPKSSSSMANNDLNKWLVSSADDTRSQIGNPRKLVKSLTMTNKNDILSCP